MLQNKELPSFTLKRYQCINKNFWWFRFLSNSLAEVAEILKNVQNKTTKRFTVGNTKVNNILALTAVSKSKIPLTSYNFVKHRTGTRS